MRIERKISRTIGRKHGSTCSELLALLNDYVDGSASPSVCRSLEHHLVKCNPCRIVVDNVRKTISLYRKDGPCRLSVTFRKRLHSALRECWNQSGPGQSGRRKTRKR